MAKNAKIDDASEEFLSGDANTGDGGQTPVTPLAAVVDSTLPSGYSEDAYVFVCRRGCPTMITLRATERDMNTGRVVIRGVVAEFTRNRSLIVAQTLMTGPGGSSRAKGPDFGEARYDSRVAPEVRRAGTDRVTPDDIVAMLKQSKYFIRGEIIPLGEFKQIIAHKHDELAQAKAREAASMSQLEQKIGKRGMAFIA